MFDEEIGSLVTISRSRTEPARRVVRVHTAFAFRAAAGLWSCCGP